MRPLAHLLVFAIGLAALLPQRAEAEIVLTHLSSFGHAIATYSGTPPRHEDALDDDQITDNPGLSGSVSASAGGSFAIAQWSVSSQGATAYAEAAASSSGQATVYFGLGFRLASTTGTVRYRASSNYFFYDGVNGALDGGADANMGPITAFPRSLAVTVVWTDGPYLPGERDNPKDYPQTLSELPEVTQEMIANEIGEKITIIGNVDVANDVTGQYLTSMPVDGPNGVTAPVYFGGEPVAAASLMATPAAAAAAGDVVGYYFHAVSDAQFTSFIAPDGIAGDTTSIQIFDGTSILPYLPGTTFTFAAPVTTFAILGLDPAAMPATGPAPFVHGLTFAEAGSAIFAHGALVAVPEPSSLVLGGLAATALLTVARRRTKPHGHG